MFDVSFFELIIIGLVGLLVLGPDKLLQMARFAGRLIGKWRRQFSDMKDEIDREMRVEEMRKQLAKEEAALRDSLSKTTSTIDETKADVTAAVNGVNSADGSTKTP